MTIRTPRPTLTVLALAAALVALSAPAADAAEASTVQLLGTVVTVHADAPMVTLEPAPPPTNELVVNGALLDVPGDALEQFDPGDKVTVTVATDPGVSRSELVQGLASGDEQAAADLGATTVAATQVAEAVLPAAAGQHTVTVLPIYFTSKDTATVSSLTTMGQNLRSYWAAQSGGALDLTVTVADWAQVADPGGCNYQSMLSAALAANGKSYPASAFQHYVVYFPFRAACNWAGLATVGGSLVWLNGYQIDEVVDHEFGHNFGIGHAWTSTCTVNNQQVEWAPTCSDAEYADTADVMGYAIWAAPGNLNTSLGDALGLVTSQTASTSSAQTVDLAPLAQTSALRALKVPGTNGTFFFDYRPAAAPDVRRTGWAGVQVHYRPNGSYPMSRLLDMRPGQNGTFTSTSMPVNGVWQVPGGGVGVRLTGIDANGAHLAVTPVGADSAGPTGVSVTSPAASASVGQGSTLAWQPGTDAGTGLGGYVVRIDGVTTNWLAPGTTQLTLPSLAMGAHSVQVDAVDQAGNVTTGTPRSFTVAAGVENSATIINPSANAWVGSRITVNWTMPAAAPVAVAVDGTVQATAALGTTTADVSGLSEGDRSVTLLTKDGSGNTVATSAAVAVTVDATAPSAPSGVALNGSTISWTAGTDSGSGICFHHVTVDGSLVKTVPVGTNSSAITVPDGAHSYGVKAQDCAGNLSAAATLTTVRDTTRPSAPVVTGPSAGTVLNATSTTVTWQPAADPDSGISGYRVTVGRTTTTAGPSVTSATVELAEGSNAVKVTAVNGAGLTTDSASVSVLRDTVAPTTPGKVTLSADGHTLTWTASKDKTALTYRVVVDGGTPATVSGTTTTVGIQPGKHAFSVTARDAAGNTSAAGTSGDVWFDTSAPSAPVVTSPSAGSYLRSKAATISWTAGADADSGVVSQIVYVNGKKLVTVDGSATSASVTLLEKANSIVVKAVNGAKLETSSAAVAVTVDSVTPKTPAKLSFAGGTLTWAAAKDSGTSVTYLVSANGGDPIEVTDPTATLSLPDGRHTVVVVAQDAAGNTSGEARVDPAWVDASAPTAPAVTSPSNGSALGGRSVTVTWTPSSDDDSGVAGYRLSVNGGAYGKLLTGTSAAVRVVADGILTVGVVAVNLAGTPSAETVLELAVSGSRMR